MANTLDNVLIKYSDNDGVLRTVTYKAFVEQDPKQLSKNDQKVFPAISELYQLNNREPPLYHSFEDVPQKPLTIDLTKTKHPNPYCYGLFNGKENSVYVHTDNFKGGFFAALEVLAHELKHAEQQSEETRRLEKENGLIFQQISFLKEAQAFSFGNFVRALYVSEKGNFRDVLKCYFSRSCSLY